MARRAERLPDPAPGPPTRSPLSVEERVDLGARFIVDDIAENFFNWRAVNVLEANTVAEPVVTDQYGGMAIQRMALGRASLGDDEAFVLHSGSGGSEYWVLSFYDHWLMSRRFWDRTCSFNDTQAEPNDDGSYTFVFSAEDPGVHNWVDTLGLGDFSFLLRYNRLPQLADGVGGEPWTKGQKVKLAEVEAHLPPGAKMVDSEERQSQLRERKAAFDLRYSV